MKTMEACADDPFMGESSLDEALRNSKITSQSEVLARLLNRENLFISGMAGTGKTTVINRFIELIDAEYGGNFNIAVTASTGIAATLIGGKTIHSWSGMGISTDPFDPRKTPAEPSISRNRETFKSTDVLIIDEISMLPAYLWTKLDEILKHFRKNDEPFGGVQIVAIGDFMQLPPVSKGSDDDLDTRFVIETKSWKLADFGYCYLDKSHRAADIRLKRLLVEIGSNNVSSETRKQLKECYDAVEQPDKVYTTLYTTNRDVDSYNQQMLDAEEGRSVEYHMIPTIVKMSDFEKLKKKTKIPDYVELKVGAIVMLTKNLDMDGLYLANGSLGRVVSLGVDSVGVKFNSHPNPVAVYYTTVEDFESKPVTTMKDGNETTVNVKKTIAGISFLPLKLAYAITVHKSQGQTFDGVRCDLSKCFADGLGYVALSRVRSLDDLIIDNMSERALKVSDKSRNITRFVKHRAVLSREQFVEERSLYEGLLTDPKAREKIWDISESGVQRSLKNGRRNW